MVLSETLESNPPNTPAIHNGVDSPSQIMMSSLCNFLVTPSKVINSVSAGKFLTITLLLEIFDASKACKGCPNSCKT